MMIIKTKTYFIVGITTIVMTLSGCQKKFGRLPLYFQNNSSEHLKPVINGYSPTGPYYPDTSLFHKKPEGIFVAPRTKEIFSEARGSYESLFTDVPNDTISFVIYDADTLAKHSWSIIREEYKIVQRYDLSMEDLQKLNFTLYYPPINSMKNMKMWPKYGAK